METNTIPHEEIRQRKDRSWTFRLMNLLMQSSPDDDVIEIAYSLGALDDPRAIAPLLEVVQDSAISTHIRNAVCISLSSICTGCDEFEREKWWRSGDEVLTRLAVMEAKSSDADFVIPIASDPTHRLHLEAIDRLQWGFVEPEYQRLLINAVEHPNARVREVAAHHLVWEEPIEAEAVLIRALYDPDDDVADEALFSISYFRTQNILKGLAEASISAPESRRAEIAGVFGACRKAFADAYHDLSGDSQECFALWLRPILHLIDLNRTSVEEGSEKTSCECRCISTAANPKILLQGVDEIIAFFDEADGCWNDKQSWRFECDWNSFCETARLHLAAYFTGHTDHSVRQVACVPFGLWNRGDLLANLLQDPCSGVRKSAAYQLKQVSPDTALAPILWKAYDDVNCIGYADEALEAFVMHSSDPELPDLLLNIALGERRTCRKVAAISKLRSLAAHTHLQKLMFLLAEPPLVNWSVHRELVHYCYELEIDVPYFTYLSEIDDLEFQEILSRTIPFQSRHLS